MTASGFIRIAILAMGGEGGGVLADWLVALAEANGFLAQSTSVPGVAQRTGATIYYVEMFPEKVAAGRLPIFALMPVPGDVDVVVASELMEAARAVQRGLVTPDRTTLIASTHRVYAMTERMALGDSRADAGAMLESCAAAAQRFVAADMRELAEKSSSVISAALFGAVAGANVLPFARAAFEGAIRAGGVGVKPSLLAFAAGFDAAAGAAPAPAVQPLPDSASAIIAEGMRRLTDYQDAAYAQEYRTWLQPLHGAPDAVLAETARHLALWMSFEDPIRVADLKIRASRFARVRHEVGVADGQILRVRDYTHPRVEEIADTLPGPFGRWLDESRVLRALVGRLVARGHVIHTSGVPGFLLFWAIAGLRRWRRSTRRYGREQAAMQAWLAQIIALAGAAPHSARAVAQLQGLVTGYGDTHARGQGNFDRIMPYVVPLLAAHGDAAAAARIDALLQAALEDDTGTALGDSVSACKASLHRPVPPPGHPTTV